MAVTAPECPQNVTRHCSLILATDKTLDDMDSPSRAIMLALQRLSSGSSRSNGIWAGGGAAVAARRGPRGSRGRQLQLSSVGSSVGAVTRSSPLIRLSVCQTLTKPLTKSSKSLTGEVEEGGSVSSVGGTGTTAGAGAQGVLRLSSSDSNVQRAAGTADGSGPSSKRPPLARHRRAHSSSSTGAVAGGDTLVSGALTAALAAEARSSASTSSGGGSNAETVREGLSSSGGGGGGGTISLAAPAAASAVNKAAIISFRKIELLVGTLDLNTDQVGGYIYMT